MPTYTFQERFQSNVARVRALVATYTDLAGAGRGRASVEHGDILRAAVLLLHAALEDLLRSMEETKLPSASARGFEGFRLPLPGRPFRQAKDRFTLVELAEFRGRSVDDVFREAIDLHLEHSNYNNVPELVQALERVEVRCRPRNPAIVEAMMRRRHLIAHRADRNPMAGSGHHLTQSIGRELVLSWTAEVESFGGALIAELTGSTP